MPGVKEVLAQVRDNPEVLLAPALEVFAGSGTTEEFYLVCVTLVTGALIAAIIAVNITWLLHKLTWSLLGKIFSAWLLFAASVSLVTLTKLVINPTRPIIQAEATATPQNVVVRIAYDSITVLWQTDKPTLGQLKYKTRETGRYQIINSNQSMKTQSHEVRIKRSDMQYWFVVISDGFEYGSKDQPLYLNLVE